MFLMVFASWQFVTLVDNFLNIYQGIIFRSLFVSILYSITMLLLSTDVFNFAVSTEWLLLKHTELILAISRSSSVFSCVTSCSISLTTQLFLLHHTLPKCPILLHSVHILPYTQHCLGRCVPPQYLHGCHGVLLWCIGIFVLLSMTFLGTSFLSKCLDSVIVFNTAAWALCASTLLAHSNTPPLVIWSSFFAVVNSFIISSSMVLSCSPCINCSLRCLLTSW